MERPDTISVIKGTVEAVKRRKVLLNFIVLKDGEGDGFNMQ
jgi:hypothetical protein